MLNSMWPGFYMEYPKQFPNAYQLNHLTSLAVSECDADDGVKDGIISDPDACLIKFSPSAHLGKRFSCPKYDSTQEFTTAAVKVAQAIWNGPVSSTGKQLWYGFNIGTDLSTMAATNCTNNGQCFPGAVSAAEGIDQAFVSKQVGVNVSDAVMTHERFDHIYYSFKQQFDSLLGTHDPDYSAFEEAGGKMIAFHGLADQAISPNGTLHFYRSVSETVPDAQSFYRYFNVPGLGHCWGGPGGQPVALFDQLRLWVENGTAPESSPVTIAKSDNSTQDQIVCP